MTSNPERPILVFQMAKVASRSWVRLLDSSVPQRPKAHFHSMSLMSLDRIDHAVRETGAAQTIKHLSLPRLGRPPDSVVQYIKDGRWVGPGVDIVCGVRDPVSRAVSAVAFLSHRLGYTRYGVTTRDGGTAESLNTLFHEVLCAARTGERPQDDTLVQVLSHAVFDFRRWFSEELAPGFGFDLTDAEFDRNAAALTLEAGVHRALVYRVEDLGDEKASLRLATTASQFFGTPVGKVPAEDSTGEARFRALYKEFIASISLSDDDMDWFYDNDMVKAFYTDPEVAAFRARWSR